MAETVTLVGNGWRKDVSAEVRDTWQSAIAGGIGVERIEPMAIVASADVEDYEFGNGWFLERDTETYRIVARSDSDVGETTLTLAKT